VIGRTVARVKSRDRQRSAWPARWRFCPWLTVPADEDVSNRGRPRSL